jgi:hypothetical protein
MKKILGILVVVGWSWSLAFSHAQAARLDSGSLRSVNIAPEAKAPDTSKKQPPASPPSVRKTAPQPSPPSDKLVPRRETAAQKPMSAPPPPPKGLGIPRGGEPNKIRD